MSIHPNDGRVSPPRGTRTAGDRIAQRIPKTLTLDALERLISVGNTKIGARRLKDNAPRHGIDLDLLWGVIEQAETPRARVTQVCMVVPGAGGTGMCFLSSPKGDGSLGPRARQQQDVQAALSTALDQLHVYAGDRVRLAQCLVEEDQGWARLACEHAAMTCVGTLDYMRLPQSGIRALPDTGSPERDGFRVRSMTHDARDEAQLLSVLDRSYEDTLDCPELCGLRSAGEVLESHKSTGVYSPSNWWLLSHGEEALGCCLLTQCPASESVELVYLGLAKPARGKGLGRDLLVHALKALRAGPRTGEVTCAVDRRNTPACSMYRSLGFRAFDARVGFVRAIGAWR